MSYVLLVEDDPCNQMVIQDIFEFDLPGRTLVCVESGEDALLQAKQAVPSLVLMDINLPGISGLEATKRLKEDRAAEKVVVWALTAHAMKGDERSALEAGCDDYITKPIDAKVLTRRLGEFLTNTAKSEEVICIES